MKYIFRPIVILLLSWFFLACEDQNFLDQIPKDTPTEGYFWKTVNDLEVFANGFYPDLGGWPSHGGGPYWADNNSDNMIPGIPDQRLSGLITISDANGWNWGSIRSVNLFLQKSQEVIEANGGTNADIDHLIGEGYWFRAKLYFDKLQMFGGVPWIDQPLQTNSDEYLFAPRESRDFIADKILSDLDMAISLMKDDAGEFRLNRFIALALKSRVALYEGAWEKYHNGTVFGINNSDPNKYFTISAAASKAIMDQGPYRINNSTGTIEDYITIFNQEDLTSNPEVMFWKKYQIGFNATNAQRAVGFIPGNTGASKAFINSHLCLDGMPIAVSDLYKGDNTLQDEFINRDPRLNANIYNIGDAINQNHNIERIPIDKGGENRCTSGYFIKKGSKHDLVLQQTDFGSTTAYIYFRFAEILLNYAEAKAELGTLTQEDIDITINVIRKRAGMPEMFISSIQFDPNWDFPSLSPILNEIRRERRVEFGVEGHRLRDLLRWRAHELFKLAPKGFKYHPEDYADVSNFSPFVDAEGYLEPYQIIQPGELGFDPERDYLLPIPLNQLKLNNNLTQNPGWPIN